MLPRLLILSLAVLLLFPARSLAQAQPDLQAFNRHLEAAIQAVEHADVKALQAEYAELHEEWEAVEDGVRSANTTAYAEIEEALQSLQAAAFATPANMGQATTSLEVLEHELEELTTVYCFPTSSLCQFGILVAVSAHRATITTLASTGGMATIASFWGHMTSSRIGAGHGTGLRHGLTVCTQPSMQDAVERVIVLWWSRALRWLLRRGAARSTASK